MDTPRPVYRSPDAPKVPRHPTFVYLRRRFVVIVVVGVVVVAGYLVVTLGVSLTNKSYGPSLSARAAQWGRAHGFGTVVSWAENEEYRLHPAVLGGTPPRNSFGSGPVATASSASGHLAAPATLASLARSPLPGEGVWHVVGQESATGAPSAYEAFVRPDGVHTSYVDGVLWMDTTLLSARLYSSSSIPGGGPYSDAPPLTATDSSNLVAAFDAGLPLSTSHGGYYTDGDVVATLRRGAASVVIYKDGTMTVAQWGRDVTMSNQIASVRQNLDLIVDGGEVVKGLSTNASGKWDATLAASDSVWRSGVGVTNDGAVIYVGGPGLSLKALAKIFVDAKAQRAMELSVNPDWVQLSVFKGALNTPRSATNGTSLLASMVATPSGYFDSWWTRDFFTMTLRPSETTRPKQTNPTS
jgi:hypothetical protein